MYYESGVSMSSMSDSGLVKTVHRKFQSSMTEHYRSHLDGTNINTNSMLTTDYLNHFSGVLMLLEMLPADLDGVSEDVLSWQPVSYEEHFDVTGFPDSELAKKAYEHAPRDVRDAFDQVIDELNSRLTDVLDEVRRKVEARQTEALARLCEELTPSLHELIAEAATIVNHGKSNVVDLHSANDEKVAPQAEIDALFD